MREGGHVWEDRPIFKCDQLSGLKCLMGQFKG
jgi:hypothetical protein